MAVRHTLETFTAKAREIHGDRYQYLEIKRETGQPSKALTVCQLHGQFWMRMGDHIAKGAGCPKCGNLTISAKRKLTFEDFQTRAKAVHGDTYEYLSLNFVRGRSIASILCKEHGVFTQGAAQHLCGQGCVHCGNKRSARKRTLDYSTYVARAKKVHGDLYEYEPCDSPEHLSVICKVHGPFKILKHGHINGQGCSRCADRRNAESMRLSLAEAEEKAREVHGDKYQYVSLNHATNSKATITAVCSQHGEFTSILTNHLGGAGCPPCGFASRGEKLQHRLETFIPEAEKVHGVGTYTYLKLEAEGGKTHITYVCPKHGEHTQVSSGHLRGAGCPSCKTAKVSVPNLQMKEYLDSLEVQVDIEYRFLESRKFFDLALHSAKVVVEYNGNYWHSSEWIPSGQHLEKSRIAEANGYRCIHIRSDEWENKRTAVEYLLKSAAGKVSEKVYARKTKVVKPSKLEASRMLDTYHIQGAVLHGDFYGLEEDGQLVAVMVFSRNTSSRREKASDSHVELTRYVTCKQVVGGFTKLLNAFLKYNPEVITISSYSDVRIFQGGVYEKAGFVKMHTTPPDYMYLEKDRLYHKANYQKSKLAKRFDAAACEGKTERQITEEQGIYRVYDCGKVKWLYTRK